MPPPPAPVEHWYEVIVGSLGLTLLAAIYAMMRYFDGKKAEPTSDPEIAARAVHAASVDKSASDAIVDMAGDVRSIRRIHERREKADQEDDLLDRAVERLRLEDKGKSR